MKQTLRYSALAIALTLTVVLVWLFGTTSGLRWAFNRLAPMMPAEISAETIDGRLIGPIEIDDLQIRHPAMDIRIGRVEFDWTPIALLRAMLHIDRLYLRDIDMQPRERTQAQTSPGNTVLPLALRIDSGRVENLTLRRAAGLLTVERADIAGSVDNDRVEILRLAVELNQSSVAAHGTFVHNNGNELDGTVQWSADIAGVPHLEGGGTLRASARQVTFKQRLTAPSTLELAGELRQADGIWRWSANLLLEHLALRQWHSQWPALSVSGRLEGQGSLTAFGMQAALQARHADQPMDMPSARLQTRLDWQPKSATLATSWQNLAWPVAGKWVTSPKGELIARGRLSDYTLRTDATLRYDAIAMGQLHARAHGNNQQLRLDRFVLQGDGARLAANGVWRRAGFDVSWNLNATNLARTLPALAGAIVSQGRAHGTIQQPRIDAFVDGRGLASGSNRIGTLRARAQIDARRLRVDLSANAVEAGPIALDRVRIEVNGTLADHRLHSELLSGERRLTFELKGGYAGGAWSGRLAQARLVSERYGTWHAEPAGLTARSTELALDTWCWHREQNRLCIGGRWNRVGPPENAVSLRLAADMRELSLIGALMPEVEALCGQLHADIRVEGTVAEPRLAGRATLAQASFRVPQLGIGIKDAELQLQEAGANSFAITARARSADGVVTMKGRIGVGAAHPWDLRLFIDGDNFEAVNTADARILVSPSLELDVHPRVVRVTGSVQIPRANFHPLTGAGAVRSSPDTVIVGTPQSHTPADWAVDAQVRIILGNDVNVSGFKLNAKVAGEVTVQERPKQPTLAQGEFRIAAGEYELYGQKIRIERGRLVYTGGTIDDPGLDMRATRRINDDVLVGVEARGTLRSPRLQLVSEPAMSDTDVLSYLLLGHASTQASQNEGNLLYRAATGLGLSGGEALARRLGAIFGVRDVRIEEDEKTKTTSLLFGTYLSPRLYVSYGVGLFDAINTLRLRYQLSQHWTVQTESGADTGVDLLYTIER